MNFLPGKREAPPDPLNWYGGAKAAVNAMPLGRAGRDAGLAVARLSLDRGKVHKGARATRAPLIPRT